MAAAELKMGPVAARRFYEAYGRRFHVDQHTVDDVDRLLVATHALEQAGLPM